VPPRLLIVSFSVCPAPDRHGVGLLNVLKALAPRHQVDVLTLRPAPGGMVELPFVERFMKTRMLRVPVGHGSLAEQVEAFARAIRRQLEGEEYDVVHLRSAWGGAAVLSGMQSGRFVYEVARSTEGEPRAADADLAARLSEQEQLCLERAELVLVPTARAQEALVTRGLSRERSFVVPPGVDVDHFDWEDEPAGVERVLYAGQIAGGRGVRLLLSAVGQIRRRRPVKLVLAGAIEDGFRPALEAAREEANLERDDVELLGPIDHDDMPRVIAQASVCVAPASPDADHRPLAGFPTKLLEYMACKRAVVAPRRSSVEEVIEDGQDGLLFEPGDAADLGRALHKLLDDAPLRRALAESGYRRVRQDFPASATRRRLLDAYGTLLPSSEWLPPGKGAQSIDALPSHPDTTARRVSPFDREWAEVSGVIEIPQKDLETLPIEIGPREIIIEAVDFEEAGEARDATIEPLGASDETIVVIGSEALVEIYTEPRARLPEPGLPEALPEALVEASREDSAPRSLDFEEESKTRPYGVRVPAAPASSDEDGGDGEPTTPGQPSDATLRGRRPSG
jgi:glycosyltransferase involved in cell wall biosynthesis